jgi:replicative DNA helicase
VSAFDDLESERILLFSMLTSEAALFQAVALGIQLENFYDAGHRRIALAIQKVLGRHERVDEDSVRAELECLPDPERLKAVLEDLLHGLYVARRDVHWHLSRIQERAQRRQLLALCERTSESLEDSSLKTEDCFSRLYEDLLQIQSASSREIVVSLDKVMPAALEQLQMQSVRSGLVGLPTGLNPIDESTSGIRLGEFWVLGALPGRGKTAVAAQIALANVRAGNPCTLFSLEMSRAELGVRFIANSTQVSSTRLRNPAEILKSQWAEIDECVAVLRTLPLYIDDSPSLSLQQLCARARLAKVRYGCSLVIVDYLRMVKGPGKDIREQVSNVADGLRQLAKSEEIAVIALSQLARPKDRKPNVRPSMLDLKESGDIEAHAHVVLLLHTPMDRSGEPTGNDEIVIGKNRHGPVGSIEVTFNRRNLRFENRGGSSEQPMLVPKSPSVAG